MKKEIIQKLYESCPQIEDLLQNAYAVDISDSGIKIQGGFNSDITKKYKELLKFTIDTNGYLEGGTEINGINFHIVLT